MWEVGRGQGKGEKWREMGTIVIEQQLKKEKSKTNKQTNKRNETVLLAVGSRD